MASGDKDLPKVMVARFNYDVAFSTLCKAFNAFEIRGLSSIEQVVIKVNLCDYRGAESGATTDPVLLDVLTKVIRLFFGQIPVYIAENDATSLDANSAFRYMGITSIAERNGASLLNFAECSWTKVPIPNGKVFSEVELPTILSSMTLYVNFAKMKINSGSQITGCLKNNYALLRLKNKAQYHSVLSEVLHDINLGIQRVGIPLLCLIDGSVGMETIGGPAFGRPKRCELLIAGTDPVAVDACEARIMGFKPRRVQHVRLCAKSKIGSLRYILDTNVGGRLYRDYRFRFERCQYWLRRQLKTRAGIGA